MNIYLLPDPHLGHKRIVEGGHRPEGFEAKIMNVISKTVRADDILIVLGDVSFLQEKLWQETLRSVCKGKMWLTLGNHDTRSLTWYMERGWDFVGESIRLNYFSKDILFSHKPTDSDADINIHGHLHNMGHRLGYYHLIPEYHKLLEIESEIKLFNLKKICNN